MVAAESEAGVGGGPDIDFVKVIRDPIINAIELLREN